jgi:ribosomal protein S18 acetylase RimI-like enzyme
VDFVVRSFSADDSETAAMTIKLLDITIRPFVQSDVAIVLDKHRVIYSEEFGFSPDAFSQYVSDALDEFLDGNGRMLWIAEYPNSRPGTGEPNEIEEPRWAGCVAIAHVGNSTGRLRFLLVEAPFRSCGLGRRLMEVALGYCEEMKYNRIVLSTAGDCQSAIRMYRKYGFRMVKSAEATVWGGKTDEWWEKMIDGNEPSPVAALNVGLPDPTYPIGSPPINERRCC